MTSGKQIRDFLPVEAVAAKFLDRSINHVNSSTVKVFNLSTGNPSSLATFAKHWWSVFGAKGRLLIGEIPLRPDEVLQFIPGDDLLLLEDVA